MDQILQKFKALGDENRFRILMMLLIRPLCACEILEVLDIKGGTLSAHLKQLKNAGLISQKKEGRWILYSLHSVKITISLTEIKNEVNDTRIIDNDRTIIDRINRTVCSAKNRL